MRNLYEQCLKLTQLAAMEFEEIFQFSQERLKQALETELIENGYAVQKQKRLSVCTRDSACPAGCAFGHRPSHPTGNDLLFRRRHGHDVAAGNWRR